MRRSTVAFRGGMRAGLAGALVALAIAAGLPAGCGAETRTLRGRVRVAGTSSIPAAVVTVFEVPDGPGDWPVLATVRVGPDGAFSVPVLPPRPPPRPSPRHRRGPRSPAGPPVPRALRGDGPEARPPPLIASPSDLAGAGSRV